MEEENTLYRIQKSDVDSFLENENLSRKEREEIYAQVSNNFGNIGIMELLQEFVSETVEQKRECSQWN